ncbi:unnamed protein product [Effrenium voratum]|nr:unnamed protein product [Effrenium voratum]
MFGPLALLFACLPGPMQRPSFSTCQSSQVLNFPSNWRPWVEERQAQQLQTWLHMGMSVMHFGVGSPFLAGHCKLIDLSPWPKPKPSFWPSGFTCVLVQWPQKVKVVSGSLRG